MAQTCILVGRSLHLGTALAVSQPSQRPPRPQSKLVVASASRRHARVVPKASLTAGSWADDKAPGLEELIQAAVQEGRNSVWWPAKKDAAAVEPPLVLAAVDQTEMDKGRAAMRDWWLKQKQSSGSSGGSGGGSNENGRPPADQKELDKARAEMRAWWLKQKQQGSSGKSGGGSNENGRQPADQKELDKARAEMRAWWLKQKQSSGGRSGGGSNENGRPPADQKELDQSRAEMRTWWTKKKTGYGAGTAAKPAAPKDNVASKKVAAGATKAKSSGPASVVDISQEVERASREYRAKQDRERALIQKPLDDSRAYMRKWWTQQLALKAAASSNVWKLVPDNGGEPVKITGDENTPILFGAGPFDSNDGKTYELNLPGVSSRHARVYAKNTVTGTRNRVTGMPQYRRDYVVKDLGTTNGVFKNGSKIRPKVEVRLAPGDVVIFGDGKARFTVQKA